MRSRQEQRCPPPQKKTKRNKTSIPRSPGSHPRRISPTCLLVLYRLSWPSGGARSGGKRGLKSGFPRCTSTVSFPWLDVLLYAGPVNEECTVGAENRGGTGDVCLIDRETPTAQAQQHALCDTGTRALGKGSLEPLRAILLCNMDTLVSWQGDDPGRPSLCVLIHLHTYMYASCTWLCKRASHTSIQSKPTYLSTFTYVKYSSVLFKCAALGMACPCEVGRRLEGSRHRQHPASRVEAGGGGQRGAGTRASGACKAGKEKKQRPMRD